MLIATIQSALRGHVGVRFPGLPVVPEHRGMFGFVIFNSQVAQLPLLVSLIGQSVAASYCYSFLRNPEGFSNLLS